MRSPESWMPVPLAKMGRGASRWKDGLNQQAHQQLDPRVYLQCYSHNEQNYLNDGYWYLGLQQAANAAGRRLAIFADGVGHRAVHRGLSGALTGGEQERAEDVAIRIVELCVEFGGSITGEHGVGREKVCSMPKMFTGDDLTVFDRVRAAFDPAGLCNPEKLLPTPRLCGEVPGPYRIHPLERIGVAERL